MSATAIQAGLFVMVVALLVKPVGAYLERVFELRQTFLDAILLPIERLIHRLIGADCLHEMDWKRYSLAFGTFGLVNIVLLYFASRVPMVFSEGHDHAHDTGPRGEHGREFCEHHHMASVCR